MQEISSNPSRTGILAGLIDRNELAEQLNCCKRTIITLEQKHGLPALHIGKARYYQPDAVRAWVLSHSSAAAAA